ITASTSVAIGYRHVNGRKLLLRIVDFGTEFSKFLQIKISRFSMVRLKFRNSGKVTLYLFNGCKWHLWVQTKVKISFLDESSLLLRSSAKISYIYYDIQSVGETLNA